MNWWARYIGISFQQDNCWQLVRRIYREQLGIDLPEYGDTSAEYMGAMARLRSREGTADELRKAAERVRFEMERGQTDHVWRDVKKPQTFDVALMRAGPDNTVRHVGIMADPKAILHVEDKSSACIVPLTDFSIRHRVAGFRRHIWVNP